MITESCTGTSPQRERCQEEDNRFDSRICGIRL